MHTKPVSPLRYHQRLVAHLQGAYPSLWSTFHTSKQVVQAVEQVRLSLLKEHVALSESAYPELYEQARAVATSLALSQPVELWQGRADEGLNASLHFHPDKLVIVLFGGIQEVLNTEQLKAVFAHELSHHLLFSHKDGELFCAQRVLHALAMSEVHPSIFPTLRRFSLATEVAADRGALLAGCSLSSTIACMLRVHTGLKNVDTTSFIKQAMSLPAGLRGSEAISHPELSIRARCLAMFQQGMSDDEIEGWLFAQGELTELDQVALAELSVVVRTLIDEITSSPILQTEVHLAHAKLFFEDFLLNLSLTPLNAQAIEGFHPSVVDYLSFVLLDFATVGENSIAEQVACQVIAERLGFRDRFEKMLNKELRVTKRTLRTQYEGREDILQKAKAQLKAPIT